MNLPYPERADNQSALAQTNKKLLPREWQCLDASDRFEMTPDSKPSDTVAKPAPPTFAEAFWFWLKLGFISFGGPSGQIAIMHTELVERKKWISEARFLHALNYCMLLPGPEAQQLATYVGWLLHKTRGGLVAGTLFVLPSAFILWALSYIYVVYGNVPWIAAVFYGLKPAVLAIVASAVLRIGQKALKNEVMWSLAGLAFLALFFGHVPFPAIIVLAGLIGFAGGKFWPKKFLVIKGHGANAAQDSLLSDTAASPEHTRPSLARAVRIIFTSLFLWWSPIALVGWWQGWNSTLFQLGVFFSKAAMVTFGGAYAVLPYVSQQAVEHYGWLSAGQMLDGLGLAETTPGPLIIVLQFVGFIAGWHQPGLLSTLMAATLGAAITTWATFLPCFLWIFLGAPYIEQLRGNASLTSTLSAITAAVVGVILNLAVWFGLHVLFPGRDATTLYSQPDWFAVVLSLVAFIGLARWKWNVMPVIFAAALLGVVYRAIL
ncbi:chromate efflux transporter [soil metagenome]